MRATCRSSFVASQFSFLGRVEALGHTTGSSGDFVGVGAIRQGETETPFRLSALD